MGTRVLNLDNVGMSGELHNKVKGLFNVKHLKCYYIYIT